jgi:hypothetical protein
MSTSATVVPRPVRPDLVVTGVPSVRRRPDRGLPVIAEDFARAVRARSGDGEASSLSLPELGAVCAEVTSLRASIVLAPEGRPSVAVAGSDGLAPVEDLQLTLGEGPAVDAYDQGRAVLVEDLDTATATTRWPRFTPAALALGVGAVFAFPLQRGARRTGVLALYADGPLVLADGRAAELALLAGLVTDAVLALPSVPSGVVAGDPARPRDDTAERRAVVHQATRMVARQLDCSARDAFARLRARAFAAGVGVDEVAQQVVEHELRFEP